MENANNQGASCSEIIGDGDLGLVLEDNQMPTWCAGYGGSGSTYAIDEYGIAQEWCQSASLEAFTDAQYELGAQRAAIHCKNHGIPVRFVTIDRQVGEPPSGFVRHDRCENGYKLGKSDPGDQFDEAKFIARVNHYMGASAPQKEWDEMATKEEFEALLAPVKQGLEGVSALVGWLTNTQGHRRRFFHAPHPDTSPPQEAIFMIVEHVDESGPRPRVWSSYHHIGQWPTFLMLGGLPDARNVPAYTAQQRDLLKRGEPVEQIWS